MSRDRQLALRHELDRLYRELGDDETEADRLLADRNRKRIAELEGALSRARIKFWDCSLYGKDAQHPRIQPPEVPARVRIEWDGDVATCLDCGRTNQEGGVGPTRKGRE